jgi:hypothetical protein
VIQGLTVDGRTMAFVEGGETGARDGLYAAFVRTLDAQPVQIGYASRLALVGDGSAVIALRGDQELARIPTGAGAPRPLERGLVDRFDTDDDIEVAARAPVVVFRAAGVSQPMRLWVQTLDQNFAGSPRPVGPEAVPPGRHPVSPDGTSIAIAAEAGVRLLSTAGPERVIGGAAGDVPVGFSADGKSLFVMTALTGLMRPIVRVDLATGKRTPHSVVTYPPEARSYSTVRVSADGTTVAYSIATNAWDLFVIEPAPR